MCVYIHTNLSMQEEKRNMLSEKTVLRLSARADTLGLPEKEKKKLSDGKKK